jgi:hypothetical protein
MKKEVVAIGLSAYLAAHHQHLDAAEVANTVRARDEIVRAISGASGDRYGAVVVAAEPSRGVKVLVKSRSA